MWVEADPGKKTGDTTEATPWKKMGAAWEAGPGEKPGDVTEADPGKDRGDAPEALPCLLEQATSGLMCEGMAPQERWHRDPWNRRGPHVRRPFGVPAR